MCLVYGYPCELRLKEILRRNNQPGLPEGQDPNGKYDWHEAFSKNFGRSRKIEQRKDISEVKPLFKLSDTSPDDVENWIENFDKWSRPTWIAVESIFQNRLAAETRMLLMGSALEALGYAIWLYEENDGNSESCGKPRCKGRKHGCSQPGCNKPTAVGYFERAAKTLPWTSLEISEETTPLEWAKSFNTVYKGCKHADNELPDSLESHDRADEGLLIIRCWLAKKLGVEDETLIVNMESLQENGKT